MGIVTAVALSTAALAGCGGGGSEETYRLRPTVTCLVQRGANVTEDRSELYDVAEQAGVGGFMVRFGRNDAAVGVERTADDAKRSADQYRASAEFFGSEPGGLLDRRGSVVLVWEKTPTESERDTVEGCLT